MASPPKIIKKDKNQTAEEEQKKQERLQVRLEFKKLFEKVDEDDKYSFLSWINRNYIQLKYDGIEKPKSVKDAVLKLEEIRIDLKTNYQIPVSGELNSEKIIFPTSGPDADCGENNTVNVDCFLYNDEELEEQQEMGNIPKSICKQCGSSKIRELTYISHSLTMEQIEFMFTRMVPLTKQDKGFHVVDIGSRFGAIIYGASLFGGGKIDVTGIELNPDLCRIQRDIIESHDLKKIIVEEGDVRTKESVIASADLIIMNNVFSFFIIEQEQRSCWEFLHKFMKKGCQLIHHPSIEQATEHLNLSFDVKKWLSLVNNNNTAKSKRIEFAKGDLDIEKDLAELKHYMVL